MTDPQPGDFGLVKMGGETGRLIRLGQWLNGDGFADYEHAFVYAGDAGVGNISHGIVEAEPGGARLLPLHYGDVLWSSGLIPLTAVQRRTIVQSAKRYVGTPYSFADYLALAAHRLHIPAPGLRAYVASSGHQICSQLVDQCYADAGVHLFSDGRWAGFVTPGDLYQLLQGAH